MTPSAIRFVGLDTFASLSRHTVAVEIFPDETDSSEWTRHIHWGEWANLFVIAPCTGNTIAKKIANNAFLTICLQRQFWLLDASFNLSNYGWGNV